jgi:hypothetical protein
MLLFSLFNQPILIFKKMKSITSIFTSSFVFCLFNLFFSGLFGQSISPEQAKLVARNFYYQQNSEITSKTAVHVSGLAEEKMQNETMFYLCQVNQTGFVIVANDLKVRAILGYSTENGEINNLNPEFSAYLNRYKRQLAYIKKHNIENPNPEVATQWQVLSDANFEKTTSANKTTAAVTPLLTCTWGQGMPYNNQCPGNSSGKAVTGCVATAMSQVMHYHKHPQVGNGSQTESNDFGTYTVNYENAVYDWTNMPNSLASNSTNTEIPKLCYHAGISVDMDYGLSSSGASSGDAATAFGTRFGYSNGGMIDESSYTYANWKLYLKGKLNSNLPLYMRGSGPDGGHAWVCDGYDASDYFHMNWGWYGGSNGYFSVGDLSPGSYTFDDGNQVIVNTPVRPNLTGAFSSGMASSVNEGSTLGVSFTVLNMGGWKAKSSVVKYYFSTNNTWDAGDTYLTSASVGAINELALGGSASANVNVNLPGSTSGYILAKVDANTEVTETSEGDNVIAKYITIKYLRPAAYAYSFYGNFNSIQVNVAAQSTVNWTATSNQTWCGTNFNTGTGSGHFFLNIAANPNTTARSATVTLFGNGITKYITVTQKAAPAITVSPTTITKNHAASVQTVNVTSTVPYSVADNATWITPSVTSGIDGSTSFTYSLSTNYGTVDRIGTITVSGYGISKTITVTQRAFNDNACYATPLSVYSSALYLTTQGTNEGATTTTTIPATACASMMNDVWFKFTAPASGAFTVQTSTSTILGGYLSDVVMFVYQATNCSTMTMIDCIDTYNGNAMPKSIKTGIVAGSQIYVRIGTKTNISGLFNIVVLNSAVPVTTPPNGGGSNEDSNARLAEDIQNEVDMQVFPNPATEQFTLKMNYPTSETVTISVLDLTGKEVFAQSLNWEEGENSIEVPIQNLASGLYMVTLKGSQTLKTAKIYKQ